MRQIIYTTRNSGLFYLWDDYYIPAYMAEITGILWDNQSMVGRCQYCGHDYTGEECPGCAARRKEKIAVTGEAIVDIRAWAHPENAWVMSLPRHLELHYTKCGRVDVFDNWDWRIIFTDCETVDKQVVNPNSLSEDSPIEFALKFKTNVLIQYENPKWEQKPA
jgi:hypothetical protein